MTEWGFWSTDPESNASIINDYGQPMLTWLEALGGGWTAWCADVDWAPAMFQGEWVLRVGPREEGGFVKDWLYAKKGQ
jgi:hypothetical protein